MPSVLKGNNSIISGNTTFTVRPMFGSYVPWDAGNLDPSTYASLTGATFSGPVSIPTLTVAGYLTANNGTITNNLIVKTLTINSSGTAMAIGANSTTAGVEFGNINGLASTPYIDFHSSGSATTDFDARIIASAGNTSVTGQGALTYNAGAGHYFTGSITSTSSLAGTVLVVTGNNNYIALQDRANTAANNFTLYHTGGIARFYLNQSDRATLDGSGNFNVVGTLSSNGNAVWHSGNFNPNLYAPLTGANFSGPVTITKNAGTPLALQSDGWQVLMTPTANLTSQWAINSYQDGNLYFQIASNNAYLGNAMWLSRSGVLNLNGISTPGYIYAGGIAGTFMTANNTVGPIGTASGSMAKLEVRNDGSANSAAFMQFHRSGSYAGYLGLDTDNQWKVGGWSMGAVAYKLWHEGNFTPTNYATLAGTPAFSAGINVTGTLNAVGVLNVSGGINTNQSGIGGLGLLNGGATNTGYIEFRTANTSAPRLGYIGYGSTAGGPINVAGEGISYFNFTGNPPNFTNGMIIGGGNVAASNGTIAIASNVVSSQHLTTAGSVIATTLIANGASAQLVLTDRANSSVSSILYHSAGSTRFYMNGGDRVTIDSAGNIYATSLSVGGNAVWSNANNPISGAATGYVKLANGLIIQWGIDKLGGGDNYVAFPIGFPNICTSCVMTFNYDNTSQGIAYAATAYIINQYGFNSRKRAIISGGTVQPDGNWASWIAIGY